MSTPESIRALLWLCFVFMPLGRLTWRLLVRV